MRFSLFYFCVQKKPPIKDGGQVLRSTGERTPL